MNPLSIIFKAANRISSLQDKPAGNNERLPIGHRCTMSHDALFTSQLQLPVLFFFFLCRRFLLKGTLIGLKIGAFQGCSARFQTSKTSATRLSLDLRSGRSKQGTKFLACHCKRSHKRSTFAKKSRSDTLLPFEILDAKARSSFLLHFSANASFFSKQVKEV